MTHPLAPPLGDPLLHADAQKLSYLRALERKVLWLAVWMIHHANHLRPKRDGLKVGGHQASSASAVTLMTALYFDVLRPQDRVAVKPHASPVFHAIQYLFGRQTQEKLECFRAFGGAQSYPSRTKDTDDVDFSTGSEGLGVAMTIFASLAQDYVRFRELAPSDAPPGRMIALGGDAELDEGILFEALLEGWKHDIRNVWLVVDYNRQSLDAVLEDRLFHRIEGLFKNMGWNVVTLKYGTRLQEVLARPGGDALRVWIDACPNSLYSALVYQGGAAWRERLLQDLGNNRPLRAMLDQYDDDGLHTLMTNLAGHDLESLLEAFHAVEDDTPTCFIAYTIKGYGLPVAGHKDNHSALLSIRQMEELRRSFGIAAGAEWDPFAGVAVPQEELQRFLNAVPFAESKQRCHSAAKIPVPENLPLMWEKRTSTQKAFGRLLKELARVGVELGERIVTSSPDVTVSTNLGSWVSRRGIFDRRSRPDTFRDQGLLSSQQWEMSPHGQHIELGIAENNLFLLLAALGLSGPLFGRSAVPRRNTVRHLYRAGPRRTQLRVLPRRTFPLSGDTLGCNPGSRRGRPSVDYHAAARHRAAGPHRLRAGVHGRARRHLVLELQPYAG